jgi:hypothetical protein
MVEQGVVRWLVGLLTHLDAIPVPTLECCGALLMNLTLSKAGRHECEQVSNHMTTTLFCTLTDCLSC